MVNSHYQKINASYNQIERRKWPLTYALINHEVKEPRHNFMIENCLISHHIKATFHKKGQTSCLNYVYFNCYTRIENVTIEKGKPDIILNMPQVEV